MLYAQLVKPADFDPNRRFPVVVHWYGGPTLQMVSNRYGATNIFNIIERDVLYTQAGFLVWRLDNRGSFGRGHAFEAPLFGELGPVALADQLAGIDYLRTLPYVDGDRIGSDGKSFGGFLTLYALIHAPDALRCGVAGAGPTDWSLNVNPDLENLTITGNVGTALLWYCNGSITARDLTATGNSANELVLPGCTVGGGRQWDLGEAGIPTRVSGSIDIGANGLLSIQPGATLRFDKRAGWIVIRAVCS